VPLDTPNTEPYRLTDEVTIAWAKSVATTM